MATKEAEKLAGEKTPQIAQTEQKPQINTGETTKAIKNTLAYCEGCGNGGGCICDNRR